MARTGDACGTCEPSPKRMRKSDAIATLAIHAGDQRDLGHGAIFPPITTATSFVQSNLGEEGQFCYSRCGNPTRHSYETALAELEGGSFCTATSSGMAATALALELLDSGDHLVVMNGVYGGSHRLFERVRRRSMALDFTYLDLNDVDAVLNSLNCKTRMIWVETPTNPLLGLVDIRKLCNAVHAHHKGSNRIIVCVDNTFATAWNQRPLSMGADIVMLSTSKYVGGHSDMMGGALVTGDADLAERLSFLKSSIGAVASPFEAYLALRGLKTLDLRMARQCSNALQVAEYCEKHPQVDSVFYPGLKSNHHYDLCRRQMRTGGAVVTIQLKSSPDGDDFAMMRKFFPRLRYWVLAESLGGVESMINHSATMSHASMGKEARAAVGVNDTTLRLSVGIEDVNDLIQDLDFALKHCAL